jgi:hypothetical protein
MRVTVMNGALVRQTSPAWKGGFGTAAASLARRRFPYRQRAQKALSSLRSASALQNKVGSVLGDAEGS